MLLKENAKDITFYHEGRSKNRLYIYECIGCGIDIKVRSNKLGNHSGKCFECAVGDRTLRPYESVWKAIESRTKRKGWDECITYEQFLDFLEIKNCEYCNREVEWKNRNSRGVEGKRNFCTNLDRIDSSKGYTLDNLVVCCPTCNYFKSAHIPFDMMHEIGAIFAKHDFKYEHKGGKTGPVKSKITPKQRGAIAQRGMTVNNKTGYRGVHEDLARGNYVAKSRKAGRVIFLGRYPTPQEAAMAYDKYALETYGTTASLNFPIQTNSFVDTNP